MTLTAAEMYAILEFTDVVSPQSDSVVALVSMKGLTPLVEHRRLDDEWVWIPLVAEKTKFGDGTVRFPFQPTSGGFHGTVTLEQVFASPKHRLCGSKTEVAMTPLVGSVGCLKSIVGSEDRADEGWVAFSGGRSHAVTAAGEAVQITGDGWPVDLFPADGETVVLLPSISMIPEEQVFLHIPRKSVEDFATAVRPIFVKGVLQISERSIKDDQFAGVFVNRCKLPIALHHRSSSVPVSPTEVFGHCFVNARRLRQPLHSSRLLGVLEFSSSSLSPLPFMVFSRLARISLCLCGHQIRARLAREAPGSVESPIASLKSVLTAGSSFHAPGKRGGNRSLSEFRPNGRACQTGTRYGHAVIAIASDRDA
jgi:hypothetical protein